MLSKILSRLTKKPPNPLHEIQNHTLYYFDGCIFCYRVRMAMTKLGISMEMRNIHTDSQYKNELRENGGKTTVPCLKIEENGQTHWMYESADIVAYLHQKFPTSKLD